MNVVDEDQIERAERIHANIDSRFKGLPIILQQPSKIIEPIQLSRPVQHWSFPGEGHKDFFEEILQSSEECELNEKWIQNPHHELLFQMLAAGYVPDDRGEDVSSWPRKLDTARKKSRLFGHKIPDHFLDGNEPSEGETEAFYAARSLFDSGIFDQQNLVRHENHIYPRSLVSNFAVPHPQRRNGVPYLIDQLWIFLQGDSSVKLLAIEIDGRHHFDQKRKNHDAERDKILTDLGYEVWRVSGWWCCVDAWRVMAKVMAAAGALPDANCWIKNTDLEGIDSYICDICNRPMVRYDSDWIQHWEDRFGESFKAHECCHSPR